MITNEVLKCRCFFLQVCLALVMAVSLAHGANILYDDFSDLAGSQVRWEKVQVNDSLVRFGGEASRCGESSWAFGAEGIAQLDNETDWTSSHCRMDRSVYTTIGAGETFTVRWWQRWAKNPGWGLYGGFCLLNEAKDAVVYSGGDPVQAGHTAIPDLWETGSAARTYFWDWHHENPNTYDTITQGAVTMEMEISDSDVVVRSWYNDSWSGDPNWVYSTGSGIAPGNYFPSFYTWFPLTPYVAKGVVAFDNVYFSDTDGLVLPEPDMVIYDDFSDALNSDARWSKVEVYDAKVRFGDAPAVRVDSGWAAGGTGFATIDYDTLWTGHSARMERITDTTISSGGDDFVVRWLQRWAENSNWGLYGGFALMDGDSVVQTTGGEFVQAGHGCDPNDWATSSKMRSYFQDYNHESGTQYDSLVSGYVSCELTISTTGTTFKSWTNSDWSGTPFYEYSTVGVAEGTYTPAFYAVSIGGTNNTGILAFDNICFSDVIDPPTASWELFDDFEDADYSNMKWTKDTGDDGRVWFDGEDVYQATNSGPDGYAQIIADSSWTTKWARFISNQNFSLSEGAPFKIRWKQIWETTPQYSYDAGIAITDSNDPGDITYLDAGTYGRSDDGPNQYKFYYNDYNNQGPALDTTQWHSCELTVTTAGQTFKGWDNDNWTGSPTWNYQDSTTLVAGDYSFRFFVWIPFGLDDWGVDRGIIGIDDVYTNQLGPVNCDEIYYLGREYAGDVDGDCDVDSDDLKMIAADWLK